VMDRDRLLQVLMTLPDALRREYDLRELMGTFGDDVAEILGVAGAGVMLEDEGGHLRFVAASDPLLRELEHLQIELDEGPCLLAYRTGDEVMVSDLNDAPDFSAFAGKALGAGLRSVFSIPLIDHGRTLGALNFYDTDVRELSDEARKVARTLAGVATAYLSHARQLSEFRTENVQLSHALESRVMVEQAKGYLAAKLGIGPDDAWERIRERARADQRRAHDVARDVVRGDVDIDGM
jgi:GAF domain-containing protein